MNFFHTNRQGISEGRHRTWRYGEVDKLGKAEPRGTTCGGEEVPAGMASGVLGHGFS